MPSKNSTLQVRLCWAGAIVLVAGLAAAAWVYATASDEITDLRGVEIIGGSVHAVTTDSSKRYRHDLERFGGKTAVLMDDFLRWFSGLWAGRQLAFTLAFLAMGIALVCFWIADTLTPRPPPRRGDADGG